VSDEIEDLLADGSDPDGGLEPSRFRKRSVPLYPTTPPEGGTWADYFRARRAALTSASETEATLEAEPVEAVVLQTMREVEISELSSRSKPPQVAKRLIAQGWTARIGQSRAMIPPVLYVSDSEEGATPGYQKGDERYPGYERITTTLIASKRAASGEMGFALEANWNSKDGFTVATTFDPWLGREIRVGYLKARDPNQIEREEGVEPPLGLSAWLDLVCPRPASKAKKAAVEAATEEIGVWNG
jgi:hypothetical protein